MISLFENIRVAKIIIILNLKCFYENILIFKEMFHRFFEINFYWKDIYSLFG